MTIEELRNKMEDFLNAIHEYKNSENFDSTDLEYCIIDPVLCRLPRDIVYVEWYDRSDIKNIADNVFAEPVDEETVDICMHNLWNFDNSVMDNDIVSNIVNDTINEIKGESK